MSEYNLTNKLTELSASKNWDDAKLEWSLKDLWVANEPDTCLCGHFPIINICHLENKQNGKTAIVGNCCVKKFTKLPSGSIFEALSRVQKDKRCAINIVTIEHAFDKGWINQWEQQFYTNTWRKRSLSEQQLTKRITINNKILSCFGNERRAS